MHRQLARWLEQAGHGRRHAARGARARSARRACPCSGRPSGWPSPLGGGCSVRPASHLLREAGSDCRGRTPDGDRSPAGDGPARHGARGARGRARGVVRRRPGGAPRPRRAAEAALLASECALHLGRAAEAERLLGLAVRSAGGDERTGDRDRRPDRRRAAVAAAPRRGGPGGGAAGGRGARRLADRTRGAGRAVRGGTARLQPRADSPARRRPSSPTGRPMSSR